MTEKKKPKYSLAQNAIFMAAASFQASKSVIPLAIALAFIAAAKAAAQLFLIPVLLKTIETAYPLPRLLTAMGGLGILLVFLEGLEAYLRQNALFGRIAIRQRILTKIIDKVATTSYPNTLDADFLQFESKAAKACHDNTAPTEAFWTSLTELTTNLLGFLAWSFLLSDISPALMWLIAASSVLAYFVNKKIHGWMWLHRQEEAACLKPLDYICQVCVSRQYAKDIRVFCLGPWLLNRWDTAFERFRTFLFRRELHRSLGAWADLLLALFQGGFTFYYLISLTLTHSLSPSRFLLYFAAAHGFSKWVMGIMDSFSKLRSQSMELSVVREFLEWPEPFLFEDGLPLPTEPDKPYEIRLDNVSFSYAGSQSPAISCLNLTIAPGEKLAVVGLNGAGKTTLVKLICGFLDPTKGAVLLNGQDIRKYNRRDYYRLFSAVFQEFSILEATVEENITQNTAPTDPGRIFQCLSSAGLSEKILSLPQGISTKLGRQVYEDAIELSGGQTQRLMLARALYKNAPLVILDEPTAALDPIAENDIYLKYSQMTQDRTSLFISHRLASTQFCRRILFLEQGKIIEEGSHHQLLAQNGPYARLFHIQSQYYHEKGKEPHAI